MKYLAGRFVCLAEPFGKWMVWDTFHGAAATLGGCPIVGADTLRAHAACSVLQKIYSNRLDLNAIRDDAALRLSAIGRPS